MGESFLCRSTMGTWSPLWANRATMNDGSASCFANAGDNTTALPGSSLSGSSLPGAELLRSSPHLLEQQALDTPDDLVNCVLLHNSSTAHNPHAPDCQPWLDAAGSCDVNTSRGPHYSLTLTDDV